MLRCGRCTAYCRSEGKIKAIAAKYQSAAKADKEKRLELNKKTKEKLAKPSPNHAQLDQYTAQLADLRKKAQARHVNPTFAPPSSTRNILPENTTRKSNGVYSLIEGGASAPFSFFRADLL